MQTFENNQLGQTDDTIDIASRDENRLAVVKMTQQCQRTIEIISRQLDPDLFDTSEFLDAVKAMVLKNRRASVRILVFEPKTIVSRRHRLIDLVRTLPTYMQIRVPPPEYKDFSEMVFVADTTGYLHRLYTERFEGKTNFSDKRVAKYLVKEFNEMWDKATQDTNLRQLSI
ncbi:MAG: uncharacterized protein HW386_862 [Gammaproteobacteria bacterium]|nr:uncharacterized protein [Gammaproteobacteria bacterium]